MSAKSGIEEPHDDRGCEEYPGNISNKSDPENLLKCPSIKQNKTE
ncbi:hypothetical protein WFO74_14955 [Yersinia enterocolitica]